MEVVAGTTYTPVLTGYDTGAAATLTVKVVNLVDDSATTPAQAGVTESATIPGTYRRVDMPAINVPGSRYLIVWEDSANGEQMVEELTIIAAPEPVSASWAPTLEQVAALIPMRTIDDNGRQLGTFTPDTEPTDVQAQESIDQAVNDLKVHFGDDLPTTLADGTPVDFTGRVRRMATIRAAMYIELTHFPQAIGTNQSPYVQHKQLFDEQLPALIEEVSEAAGGGGGLATGEPGPMPSFGGFGPVEGWDTRRF